MSSLQDIAARVGLREETLNQPCEEDHYRSLAKLFQPWQVLYSDLLSTTELDDVRECSSSEEERSLLCMQKWKSKYGAEASYDVILRSLLKNGDVENAEAICRQLLPVSKQEKIIKDIPPKILRSQVSDYHLAEIAQDLVDWEQISPALKLTDSELREIKEDFSGRYNLQKRQALRVWRWKSGDQATYESLIQLFCSQGLVQLAEILANSLRTGKQRLRSSAILDTFHRYLLDCYLELSHPSRKQWPSDFQDFLPHVYVDLTLSTIALNRIEDIVHAGKEISSNTCQSSLMTNLSDVLSSDEQLMVLFEGVAGSGKTTLSWHACREWASKKLLQQFHLLIHVQMKDPQLHEAKHLPDLIPYPDKKLCQEVASAIIDQKGKGVCFLLDGLDEAPTSLLELLLKILLGTYVQVPHLSLIMTSRPDSRATTKLQAILRSRIIIEGFSKAKLYEFLDVSLGADSDGKRRLVQKFKINPQLESLCGLPINAVIMIFLHQFFYHDDISVTQTGLFKPLLSNFLVRHVQTRTSTDKPPEIEDFANDVPPDVQEPFRQICKLAYTYCTSSKKKKLFTSEELLGAKVSIDNSLGLLQIHPKITMYGQKRYYSFPHLSLQEFLAAVHISWKKQSEQTRAIKLMMKQDPLSRILPFYAGLTHLRDNQEAVQVLSEVLKHPVEDRTTVEALKVNFSLANDRRRQALALFNCLYESQDAKLFECRQVQLASSQLSLLGLGLTPTDCIAVAYFIRKSLLKMRMLIHRMGRCSEVGISSFVKEIRRDICTNTLSGLLRLEISNVIFTKAAIQSLKELLQGQSILQALHVLCYLDPTNASVTILLKYLIEGLSLNSSCNEVGLGFFDLRDSHVYHLILLIRGCPQLIFFTLSFDVDLR